MQAFNDTFSLTIFTLKVKEQDHRVDLTGLMLTLHYGALRSDVFAILNFSVHLTGLRNFEL